MSQVADGLGKVFPFKFDHPQKVLVVANVLPGQAGADQFPDPGGGLQGVLDAAHPEIGQPFRGEDSDLPAEDSPLLQGMVLQTARAFERTEYVAMEKAGYASPAGEMSS